MKKRSTGAPGKLSGLTKLRGALKHTAQQAGPNPYKEKWTKKAMVAAIVGGSLCGLGSCAANMAGAAASVSRENLATPSAAPVDPTTGSNVGEQAKATATAQEFVRLWLTATDKQAPQVRALMLEPPTQLALPKQPAKAPTHIVASYLANPSPNVWLVTITTRGGASGTGEHYQVPVRVEGFNASVITLPARIGDPGAPESDGDTLTSIPNSSPAALASFGFLKSYLTNGGDLDRWTSAGFTPAPITSQLCQQVVLRSVAATSQDASQLERVPVRAQGGVESPSASPSSSPTEQTAGGVVSVSVTCSTASADRDLAYQLQLEPSGGQLVVSSINPYIPTERHS